MKALELENVDQNLIHVIRGKKVMLDKDLAAIYGVQTKALNQAVKRNLDRFPKEFMFQLGVTEYNAILRSQSVTSRSEWGGRRTLPYVFTEHGAVMLASVLNSPIAIRASIEVVKAFVRLREMVGVHKEFAEKLTKLEEKYDQQFAIVFDAVRKLMQVPRRKEKPRKKIGYRRPGGKR